MPVYFSELGNTGDIGGTLDDSGGHPDEVGGGFSTVAVADGGVMASEPLFVDGDFGRKLVAEILDYILDQVVAIAIPPR